MVSEAQVSREVGEIIREGPSKTFAFPNTVVTVDQDAFKDGHTISVRLNEGLKILKYHCFCNSKIRRLVLPSSVESIGGEAFCECERLEHADLSAARGLKVIGCKTFTSCKALKHVLLNDGLETIGEECFNESGLEEVTIPGNVRNIG